MSISNPGRVATGATADDCARLWSTLTTEYTPDLRVEIRPLQRENGSGYLVVEVCNDSAIVSCGSQLVNVWASREFSNQLYLISVGQLFDLLIVAYRKIDDYFSSGYPSAPTRRTR
jgi:hypothetical protein